MALISGSANNFYPVREWSSTYPASGSMRFTCSGSNGNPLGWGGVYFDGSSGYPAQGGLVLGAGQPISGAIQHYAQTQSGGATSINMPYTIVLIERIDGFASGGSSRTLTSTGGNGDCHLTLNQNSTESWRQNSTNLSTHRTGLGTHIGIARLQSGRASYLVGSLGITSGTVNSGLKERVNISGGNASGNFGFINIGYMPSTNGPNTQIQEIQLYNNFISDADAHGIYSGAYLAYGGNNLVGSGKLQSPYLYNVDPLYTTSGVPSSIINAAITTSGSQNYFTDPIQAVSVQSGISMRFLDFQTTTMNQRLFQSDMGQLTQGYTIECMFRTTTAGRTIAGRENTTGTGSTAFAPNISCTDLGSFGFRTFNPPTDYVVTSSGQSRVIDNNWHYGVVTVTSGQIKTYVDGSHQSNVTLNSGNILAENYLGGWRIGGYKGGSVAFDGYYNGFVGFFRLQSGGLSSGQINDTYNNQIVPRYKTKTFQYTSGLQTFDLSTLPSGTSSLNFFAVGAKGGNAYLSSGSPIAKNNAIGGNGGAVRGTLNISGLANLYIGVGGCPVGSRLPVYGAPQGGLAIPADNNTIYTGGAGGGATAILGSGTVASGSILVLAGGGGGAAGNTGTDVVNGGNACIPSGSNLFFQRGANGYNGASYGTAGGFGGLCSGSPFTSGTIFARGGVPFDANSSIPTSGAFLVAGTGGYNATRNTGGGGGGGFCGGGGGAAGGFACGGGGAGASWIASGVASGQFFNSYNTTGHGYVTFSW